MSASAFSTLRARCLKWRNVRETLCVTMFFSVCVCLCWQISLQVFWGRRRPKKTISLMKTMILESRCLHVQRYALDVYVGPFRATHCVSPCFFHYLMPCGRGNCHTRKIHVKNNTFWCGGLVSYRAELLVDETEALTGNTGPKMTKIGRRA